MTRARKFIAGGAVLATIVFVWTTVVAPLRQRVKAKTTASRIRTVATILQAEQPNDISPAALQRLTSKYRQKNALKDAWGNPLAVEKAGSHYIVTSFGRDGKRSGCCVSEQEATPDTDLIAVDGHWKQIWN